LIEDLKSNLEKADFMLSDWMAEYSFYEKPDPRAAITHLRQRTNDRHGEHPQNGFGSTIGFIALLNCHGLHNKIAKLLNKGRGRLMRTRKDEYRYDLT